MRERALDDVPTFVTAHVHGSVTSIEPRSGARLSARGLRASAQEEPKEKGEEHDHDRRR